MKSEISGRKRWRAMLVGALTAVATLSVTVLGTASASAASDDTAVSGVSFEWGVNDESGGGAYFGGCNFLSAGAAGDAGASGLWTQASGLWSQSSGNVDVLKPDATGNLVPTTWANKCQNRYGTSVNSKTAGLNMTVTGADPETQPTYSENVVRVSNGSGTVNPATGSAHIEWEGSFTIVYYGGMTYWTISNPVLDIVDGKGSITGTASGYGADMDDATKWITLPTQEITVADLGDVLVTDSGISVTPDYLGVAVSDEIQGRNPQAAKSDANATWWGAFPNTWLEYAVLTGQSSYWYTSDGGATTVQPRKPASPITIGYKLDATPTSTVPAAPGKPTATAVTTSAAYGATIGWAAPSDDGGSEITGYTVTLTPETGTAQTKDVDAGSTTATFTSLSAPGVSYTATVTAKNANGSSQPSASSDAVIPNPDPSTDLALSVTPTSDIDPSQENTFTVSGTGYTGGAAVYGTYVVLADTSVWQPGQNPASAGDFAKAAWVQPANITEGSFSTTLTVAAGTLEYGKQYTVGTLAAHQLSLTDRRLDKAQLITLKAEAQAPSAPSKPTATVSEAASVSVEWRAPDNGGSAITAYTVTLTDQDGRTVTKEVDADATSATFTGLDTPGASYTATVVATNGKGDSAASEPSEAVIPTPAAPEETATVPAAPAKPTASAVTTSASYGATVNWEAPADDGGSAITGYTVRLTGSDGSTVSQDAAADASSLGFTGLNAAGVSYTAVVVAKNAQGSSQPSASSDAVVPNPDPAEGLAVSVTPTSDIDPAVDNTFTVTGSGYTGGAAIYGVYVVVADTSVWKPGQNPASANDFTKASAVQASAIKDGTFTTTITVPANTFEYGKQYTVGTIAARQLSLSDRRLDKVQEISLKDAPQPDPEAPSAPRNVTVASTSRQGELRVNWLAPQSDGGAAIDHYVVTLTPEEEAAPTSSLQSDDGILARSLSLTEINLSQTVQAPANTVLFTGLDPLQRYTASVAAVNTAGLASSSAFSASAVSPAASDANQGDEDGGAVDDDPGTAAGDDSTGAGDSALGGGGSQSGAEGNASVVADKDLLATTGADVFVSALAILLLLIAGGAATVMHPRGARLGETRNR
ncbi:fibronectin type III domain-containing protein [Bifidobacterium psychraerophilum]|uniref:fibronectin type III domain-containing protein n=2 Tax=Bifidobacterium psychraerophilum TaxID=218140 RepID=UPI0023F3BF24|nr:fibronectin type III domain-containing protein [Bifidobacterium psychraerophilum]MCI1660478.1 fibronectin type III domain-containing protein [Bifidobacterium psychraerophilum]MCI1805549.1 fibronectin type III domain-containing protein [Bifidobacterium psychraerophilum]MCI2175593.1 fibronectin type III domain-containing protein [Bifidobacterium psychraerophilum]